MTLAHYNDNPATLVTILARQGSQGCPDKHITKMLSKPLIQYTIEHALQFQAHCTAPVDIVIYSNDPFVKQIARNYPILILNRPDACATGNRPKVQGIREATNQAEELQSKVYQYVVDLDASAPLRTLSHIQGAYIKAKETPMSCCVMSVVQSHWLWQGFTINHIGRLESALKVQHGGIISRQTAPICYRANSSIYVYHRNLLLDPNYLSPRDSLLMGYIMPEWTKYHVDSEDDWGHVALELQKNLVKIVEE